ncbi:MAG: hypothetical protein JXB24_09390 [Bacteroidales bacterium]|nr:hypothetical protein [Bacteroidales bacterium]
MTIEELIKIVLYDLSYCVIFCISEIVYYKLKPDAEYTRKFVHIACGLITISFPLFFHSIRPVLILVLIFTLLLFLSKKYQFLNSVNNIRRKSVGSILYPLAILVSFGSYLIDGETIFFYLPLLMVFISDPIAAVAGNFYPILKYSDCEESKTLGGSLAFFISSGLIAYFIVKIDYGMDFHVFIKIMIISLTATFIETVSRRGFDNITVPMVVILMVYIFKI